MTDADWAACQITTNAVESQNKKGTSKTKSFLDVLSNFYLEDQRFCFATYAAREGISTGTSIAVRLKQNKKRRLKRDRPKIIDKESPCHSQSGSEPKGSKASGKKRKLPPKAPSQAILLNSYLSNKSDANVGKTVYIDTYGARGKNMDGAKQSS
ncbi:hypothetical protein DAPPUDRAFT_106877 [Daphnia pulex]|uniref:Uncharacterized protein n=1 Tax=Daphnia pulex TaxID=6669 RepID=E9GV94_DAPPU|nr:hypothetical protein DAPPUDRAFT_106877 [Daphnia pulex]|eukprot:EFX76622.1 hypothetical protein DAPPUDRAFT_106877 [Daphnia pulex]